MQIHCYGLNLITRGQSYKVFLKGNVTKRNTNSASIEDQESVESTSVDLNNDTSPQSYTLSLVNAKF